MSEKMKGVTLLADWNPKTYFKLGAKDIDQRQTYLGSQVWKTSKMKIRDYSIYN